MSYASILAAQRQNYMNISLIGWSHLGSIIVKNLRQPWHMQTKRNRKRHHFRLKSWVFACSLRQRVFWRALHGIKCSSNTYPPREKILQLQCGSSSRPFTIIFIQNPGAPRPVAIKQKRHREWITTVLYSFFTYIGLNHPIFSIFYSNPRFCFREDAIVELCLPRW